MNINKYNLNDVCEDYFKLPFIEEKIKQHINENVYSVNPLSSGNKITTVTNDINPDIESDYHMEALEFLKTIPSNSVDLLLFDPPYNPARSKHFIETFNVKRNKLYTMTNYWTFLKDEISRIVKKGGVVFSISYTSSGIGKSKGFEIEDIMILNHELSTMDVFCVMDRKL
jgi:hypothetical protein